MRRWLTNLPIRRKLEAITLGFVAVIIALAGLDQFAMNTVSTVRADVNAESLYSKGQKDATYALTAYVHSQEERDYQRFETALRVPFNFRVARLELEKPDANFEVAEKAFIEAGNHPDDVAAICRVFRRFRRVSYMDDAIRAWSTADAAIDELLIPLAKDLHAHIAKGDFNEDDRKRAIVKIDALNSKLSTLAYGFSSVLGAGARGIDTLLTVVKVLTTLVSLVFALFVSSVVSRAVTASIANLREGAARIEKGDFGSAIPVLSTDELGLLAGEFNRMSNSLVRARKIKSEFVSTISHELRTPLSLILAPLESALADGNAPRSLRILLETMHNNAVRLLQLVQGLLDFQKLEARKVEVHREPVAIVTHTESIVSDFEALAHAKQIRCALETQLSNTLTVEMDRYLYERIVFNLLSNAIKFTPKGGKITIRIAHSQTGDDAMLSLSVQDTGIGIAPEHLPQLFEKFRQIEGASTRRFEGAGLGLSLVKEFAELLGGSVRVDSAVGVGSTFTVACSAPLSKREALASSRDTQQPITRYLPSDEEAIVDAGPVRHANAKVLIVEDNAELARYVSTLLSPLCRTEIAADGDQALQAIRADAPTLVISDVMMPNRDGLSLCREVRAHPETRDIPFVLLTALTTRDALLEGWEAGADDYLFKPFHPVELVTRIRALVAARLQVLEQSEARRLAEDRLRQTTAQLATAQAAEAASARAAFLAEASGVLGASLDYDQTLAAFANFIVARFADGCVVRVVDPHDAAANRLVVRAATPEKVKLLEESLSKTSDAEFYKSVVLFPIMVRSEILGTAGILFDTRPYTEGDRELAEELVRRAGLAIENARLYKLAQDAVGARDEFLSIASHELKTPLTPLQLQLELLQRALLNHPDLKPASAQLSSALKQIGRLTMIVNQLLDVSRLTAGRYELQPERVDLTDIVRRAIETVDSDRCTLHANGSSQGVGPIVGKWDAFRVQQIVTNLLSNAVKYGLEKPVEIRCEHDSKVARVIVRDHGIGIPCDHLHRIFERFERAISARNHGGLGLGLYIANQLARAHGGRLSATSTPGEGSEFTLELPLESASAPQQTNAS